MLRLVSGERANDAPTIPHRQVAAGVARFWSENDSVGERTDMSYYRQGPFRPGGGGGGGSVTFGIPPVTPAFKGLLIACASVFLLQHVIGDFLIDWFALTPGRVLHGMVWQLGSYMFLHANLSHIFFNMLVLWMFGGELERVWRQREFLKYFAICGVGAGLAVTLQGLLGIGSGAETPTIGASGAIYGIIMAYGVVFAERRVLFMMIFPMKAKTLAMILFFFAAYYNFASPTGGVSHIAHLGGALTGLIYLKKLWRVDKLIAKIRWNMQRRRFKVMMGDNDKDKWTH